MKRTRLIPAVLLSLLASGCMMAPVEDGATDAYFTDRYVIDDYRYGSSGFLTAPGMHIGVHAYPDLQLVPGLPVYYAPYLERNYFFYDGQYWLFESDHWYAGSWYNGPWRSVRVEYVPAYVLRVPVYYYRRPPAYFRHWQRHEAPRWSERWGRDWEARHPEWRQSSRGKTPPPAPRPDYQRHYRGRDYPGLAQQRELQKQHYRYPPRERLSLPRLPQGRAREAGQQQHREEALRQEHLLRQRQQEVREQGEEKRGRQEDAAREQQNDSRQRQERLEQYERWRQRQDGQVQHQREWRGERRQPQAPQREAQGQPSPERQRPTRLENRRDEPTAQRTPGQPDPSRRMPRDGAPAEAPRGVPAPQDRRLPPPPQTARPTLSPRATPGLPQAQPVDRQRALQKLRDAATARRPAPQAEDPTAAPKRESPRAQQEEDRRRGEAP